MTEKEKLVTDVIEELDKTGVHIGCPFEGIEVEKINAMKAMPTGAFKMVCLTWRIVSQFGDWIGKGIAIGLFVLVLAVIAIGGISLLKLWGFFRT